MRRGTPAPAPQAAPPSPGAPEHEHTRGPVESANGAGPGTLRTEFPFELPRGYVDGSGTVHRHGVMRLATARDELIPLRDDRVRENSAYLSVVLIARVEDLFASDLAFLQDFYRRINAEGHTRAAVTCPSCQEHFAVDLAGGRLGES